MQQSVTRRGGAIPRTRAHQPAKCLIICEMGRAEERMPQEKCGIANALAAEATVHRRD